MDSLFAQPAAEPCSFVQVAVERSVDLADGLTYAAPESLCDLQIGDRVQAPLGRGGAASNGFIVAVNVSPDIDPSRIKPVIKRLDVRLPPALIELGRWIARYYCCPLGMTLAAMVPPAVKRGIGRVTRIEIEPTGEAPPDKLPPATAATWKAIAELDDDQFPISAKALAALVGASSVGPINRLIRLGVLRQVERRGFRTSLGMTPTADDCRHELNDAQRNAVDAITSTCGAFASHLLFGVAGSGKTEVYLRSIEQVIERGGSALVLVPEISLTPQTIERFLARFHHIGVATLHSGLTPVQRHQQWDMIRRGEAKVVVGARSAIFAPIGAASPLGLIVVDEEHDSAYKQDEPLPRYSARDAAIKRAQIEGCPVVLGSATPSLETWRNAELGRHQRHDLPERVAGALLPRVRLVDLAKEVAPGGYRGRFAIGATLEQSIRDTLRADAQVILLLNRRGYANCIGCSAPSCGWTLQCDDCDAALVQHKDRRLPSGRFLRCHHCLAQMIVPAACPVCGRRVRTFGAGTQRVEEELEKLYPDLASAGAILRLDSDTIHSAKHWWSALDRFRSGEVRILLGTQMIGKGHDFPRVRLVGIINADTAMSLPDFRAAERTFQLISQVAGRAGRTAELPGRVIVQTYGADTPAIQLAAAHNFAHFAELELACRRHAGLPPEARMARIILRDRDLKKVTHEATSLAVAIRQVASSDVMLLGPAPCPIARIAGFHRMSIELLADSAPPLHAALTSLRNAGKLRSDARTAVDVDPVSLM